MPVLMRLCDHSNVLVENYGGFPKGTRPFWGADGKLRLLDPSDTFKIPEENFVWISEIKPRPLHLPEPRLIRYDEGKFSIDPPITEAGKKEAGENGKHVTFEG